MKPTISIIILNWNGWKDTIECLESLYQINYPYYNVIVIDNCSEDNSIEKIKEYCTGNLKVKSGFFQYESHNKPIEIVEYFKDEINNSKIINESKNRNKLILIKNDKNYGFAEGNNIAIKYVLNSLKTDYVLLLNNDTVVDKNFLNNLIKAAKINKIGILGSKVYFYDKPSYIQSAGMKLNWKKGTVKILGFNEIDKNQFNDILEVDYVDGSNILIKKEVFEKIGYLNPDYFLYWEETDFCVRARKAGYKVIYVPAAKIWHKLGSTTKNISGSYEYYMTRNMFWFMKKHATKKQFLFFLVYFFGFRFWFKGSIFLLYHTNLIVFKSFLNGILDGLKRI